MQPNEKLTAEERMAELEEASMLFAAILTGQPLDPAENEAAQERLTYLFQRMADRKSQREVLQKLAARDGAPPVTVTEDVEL